MKYKKYGTLYIYLLQMYTGLHMWDEALSLAEAKGHPRLDDLKTTHSKWLLDTGQEEKAGAIKEAEGDPTGALV